MLRLMEVIEKFIRGKRPDQEKCEDGIIATDSFAAVVDGSTSKGHTTFHGQSTGRTAMFAVIECIRELPAQSTYEQAGRAFTERIRQLYRDNGMLDDVKVNAQNRFTCSAVVYSLSRNEVWFYGDCQCRFGGTTYSRPKAIDSILTDIRCRVDNYLLAKGWDMERLALDDPGRRFIMPSLVDQCSFQNDPDSRNPYRYQVIDGFDMVDMPGSIRPLGRAKNLILASDGYPVLADTLRETEEQLARLLKADPLCISLNRQTKGMTKGLCSFDDRSFLSLEL